MHRITLHELMEVIPNLTIANLAKSDFNFPSYPSARDSEGFLFLEYEYLEKTLFDPNQLWRQSVTVIREQLTIGEDSFVGLGAVVTKSLPPRSRVIGNPAKDFPPK